MTKWRKRRDSNPRYPFGYASFQDWSHQPLGHSSCLEFSAGSTITQRVSFTGGKGRFTRHHRLLFPSAQLSSAKPLSPDSLLKISIKPALKRAGIVDKQIGWHNFRHSLVTNLRAMGVDVKVAEELLRHANSRTTLDVYIRHLELRRAISRYTHSTGWIAR